MATEAKDLFAIEFRNVPGKGVFARGGLRFKDDEAALRREYSHVLDRVSLDTLLGEAALWVLWPSTAAIWAFPVFLWRFRVDTAVLAAIGLFLAVQLATMLLYVRPLNYAALVLGNRALHVVVYVAAAALFWHAGARTKVVALAVWLAFMALGVLQVIFVAPFIPLMKALFAKTPADQALKNVARRYSRQM